MFDGGGNLQKVAGCESIERYARYLFDHHIACRGKGIACNALGRIILSFFNSFWLDYANIAGASRELTSLDLGLSPIRTANSNTRIIIWLGLERNFHS